MRTKNAVFHVVLGKRTGAIVRTIINTAATVWGGKRMPTSLVFKLCAQFKCTLSVGKPGKGVSELAISADPEFLLPSMKEVECGLRAHLHLNGEWAGGLCGTLKQILQLAHLCLQC